MFNRAANWLNFETSAAYFTGGRPKFGPLMIVILFSFLGYTTFHIGFSSA
jgi:hypothetical protein